MIKKNQPRCLRCSKRFCFIEAENNKHPGYCSMVCFVHPVRKLKKKNSIRRSELFLSLTERRQLRQFRRLKRIELLKQKKHLTRKDSSLLFYESHEWKALRLQVLIHYGHICMKCGCTAPQKEMHVDHIKPRHRYRQLELDFNNLQVLCKECNLEKGGHDETDYRKRRGYPPSK